MLCKAIQLKVERIFLSQMALNSWIQQSKDMLDFMFWTTLLDCSTFCSFHCRSRVTMMTITNHSGVHGVHISKFHTLNSGTTTPIPLECIQLSFDVSFSWKECLPLVEWILLCVDYIGTGMSPIQKKDWSSYVQWIVVCRENRLVLFFWFFSNIYKCTIGYCDCEKGNQCYNVSITCNPSMPFTNVKLDFQPYELCLFCNSSFGQFKI